MENIKRLFYYKLSMLAVFLIGAQFITGCTDDVIEQVQQPEPKVPLELSGSIDQCCESRANDLGFVDGDKMGVFIVNYKNGKPGQLLAEGNHVSNMRYVYDEPSNKWTPTKDVYWSDKTTHVDVYGYYPFKEIVSSVSPYIFTVEDDQGLPGSDSSMSSYEASDFLLAKSADVAPGTVVDLRYHHMMAGVKVVLKEGIGFQPGEYAKATKLVTIDHVTRKASINFTTRKVLPVGSPDKQIIMAQEADGYRAVVVPQEVEPHTPLIGVTLDGVSYALTKKEIVRFIGGKIHQFTIKIDKRVEKGDYELRLVDEEITPWINDELSHDFEANSYVTVNVTKPGGLERTLRNAKADPTTLKNLKVTGRLTTVDFEFMRNTMQELKAVNIKEVKLVHCFVGDFDGRQEYSDDVLPVDAFIRHPHLQRVILPDRLIAIGPGAMQDIPNLTSTVVLPEGVKRIYGGAFSGLQAPIVLPNSLERIDDSAFYGAQSACELFLSDNIKYIGEYAFNECPNFTGNFRFPSKLEFIGRRAFRNFGTNMTGELVIPQNITVLKEGILGIRFKKPVLVKLHDGITRIEDGAMSAIHIKNKLILPKNLEYIGYKAFQYTRFTGELELPASVNFIGMDAFSCSGLNGRLVLPPKLSSIMGSPEGAFGGTGISELEIPDTFEQIGDNLFQNSGELRFVKLGKNISFIGSNAFRGCWNLAVFTCMAKDPPTLGTNVFQYIGHRAILQVPEASVNRYKNAPGWNQFPFITAYHELACNLRDIKCLNKGITRLGMIQSEGKWYVKECPDWVKVDPAEGDELERKTEISVTVDLLPQGSGNREGKIVFGLSGKDYTTEVEIHQYDYATLEDTEFVLQHASAGGKEIPIFIVGEGFAADDIINGRYEKLMKEQMDHFFSVEPYKTYRNYFTVSTSIALSPEKGIGVGMFNAQTRFESFDDYGSLGTNVKQVTDYVKNVSNHIDDTNISKALIILMYNTERFGGNTYREKDGTTISCCPVTNPNEEGAYETQRSMIVHEAGGVGFGRLGAESISHYEFIQACTCAGCNALNEFREAKKRGEFDNLSLSGKMNDVPWKHLIFHEKYAGIVDIFEGGYRHARGVFRSEVESTMNTYLPYYNTISRESMVRRIMKYAELPFNFDDFVKNDKIDKQK